MRTFRNQSFRGQTIVLDDSTFIACAFDRCRLNYNGITTFAIRHVHLEQCTLGFGGTASLTLNLLRVWWNTDAYHRQAVIDLLSRPPAHIFGDDSMDAGTVVDDRAAPKTDE